MIHYSIAAPQQKNLIHMRLNKLLYVNNGLPLGVLLIILLSVKELH